MATGYTHDVAEGKVTDFKVFALRCARAFGACIMQRDDPMDDPPKKALERHQKELKELNALSLDACEIQSDKDFESSMKDYRRQVKEIAEKKERYQSMLQKVEAWKPPTSEHQGLKEFMIQQLADSLKFDDYTPTHPKRLTPEEWRQQRQKQLSHSISYYADQVENEKARCSNRNQWIDDLVASL